MRSVTLIAALSLTTFPLSAQDAGKETKPAETPAAEGAAPSEIKVSEFTFKPAAPWKTAQAAPMSAGTLETGEGESKVTATFFTFGAGQGGNVEQNVQRWRGMFQKAEDGSLQKAEEEEWTFGEKKVKSVLVKGTYVGSSFRPVGPFENYALIGVVVESAEGSVFIRATGQEKAVTAAKEDLKKLVGTAFAK